MTLSPNIATNHLQQETKTMTTLASTVPISFTGPGGTRDVTIQTSMVPIIDPLKKVMA